MAKRFGPYIHKQQGYRYYTVIFKSGRKKTVYEHREVVEEMLGRRLRRREVIHHKNGDKLDNSLENLEVTTQSAHAREHASNRKPEMWKLRCSNCRKVVRRSARVQRQRKGKPFCNKSCAAKWQWKNCPPAR